MNKSIYFTKLEPFKMKSSEEFINILKSKKKYKLINKELHKIICKSESKDNYISYYINQSELFFILDDVLSFQYNNILTIDSYINKNNNKVNQNFQNNNINDNINTNDNNENKRENISINNKFINSFNDFNNNFINNKNDNYLLNITNAMIELYLIKIKMENEIKKDIEYNGIGYLIDKESIEKWRRKINYDDIKTKFFEIYFKDNNINISNEKRYEVLNFIKNSGLKIEKFEFQCLNFKSQKDIECYTQKKSLVLVNKIFYNLICDKREEGIEIEYKMKGKRINIIRDSININLYIKGNFIFSELYINLYTLIKIFYYNEEFKRICSLKQIKPHTLYLIDKESIKKYKEYFDYNYLSNYIGKNKQLENLSLNNANDKICEIIKRLPEDYINILNNKLETNKLYLDWIKSLEPKEIMTESKININRKMKYINDFEIIDTQILFDLSFFNSKINNKSIQSRFYQFNDKILIIFKDNTLFNFQIGYFKNDEFIVEYLIDLQANLDKQNGFLNLENLFKKVNIDGLLNYIYHNNDVNNFQIDDAILYFYNMPKNIFNNSIDLSYLNSTTNIIINILYKKEYFIILSL